MHPAVPLAADVLCQHTSTIVDLLGHRAQLAHGLRLAEMLRQVISQTTASITEKQIETVLVMTKQVHDELSKNLSHYMSEREKFSSQYVGATDALLRADLTTQITNIDDQMRRVRRDMQVLHRFSVQMISICAENGLKFVKDLSVPYVEARIGLAPYGQHS